LQHHWGILEGEDKGDDASSSFAVAASVVMVGDSPSNDVAYGKAAGATTALLDTGRRYMATETTKETTHQPDCIVQNLWELPRWLWLNMDIPGSLGSQAPLLKYDTPLVTSRACRAAFDGDLETLRQLPTGDLFQDCPQTGNTPLIWAADAGHDDVVEFLLQQQPSVSTLVKIMNIRGYLGATAVSRAACRGHVGCLEQLAAAGADLDVPNDKMQYPLHFAAFKQKMDCVYKLLEHGANPYVLDRKGRTPSLDTSNEEIRRILEDAMGVPN
jgi:HAD-hyrolase-like/Ankyrin repeats (3 copies)